MKTIFASEIKFKNDKIYINDECIANPQEFSDIDDLLDEVAPFYLVSEMGYGNSALVSLVWAFDEVQAVENAQCEDTENVCGIEKVEIIP